MIVRAYETPVYNYVLRLVGGDRSLAEDLTQEVFLRVFQGLPKFSLRCKFTTWLFQVTKNRVLDELRASERRPRHLVALDDIAPLEAMERPIEQGEDDRRALARDRGAVGRPEDGAAPARRRRPLVHRDRRLARDHARDGQVADLQGREEVAARPGPRGHHLRDADASPSGPKSSSPARVRSRRASAPGERAGSLLRSLPRSQPESAPRQIVVLGQPDGGQHRQPLPAAAGEDDRARCREKGAPPAHREAPPRGSQPAPARRRRGRAGTRRAGRPGRGASRRRRGSPSRGWPTEPGFRSQRPACRSLSVPPGAWPPIAPRPSTIASGTWLWPTSVTRCRSRRSRRAPPPR